MCSNYFNCRRVNDLIQENYKMPFAFLSNFKFSVRILAILNRLIIDHILDTWDLCYLNRFPALFSADIDGKRHACT